MDELRPREKEILSILVQGLEQKEIAASLQLSRNTIRNYLFNARQRTGCTSTIELAVKFYVESISTT